MLYTIEKKQLLNTDLTTAWEFMSDPKNLKVITPEYMGFDILNSLPDKIYQGQIISYHVKPILGIKLYWVTEITHVVNQTYFVDEQRFGPYSFWHHKHFLKEVESGVEMIDLIHYKIPFGIIGRIANFIFIEKELNRLFDYRFNVLNTLFNSKT